MDEKLILHRQAAKTAVVRLASDVSTICSTVRSSDLDAEMSKLAEELFESAYNAAANAKILPTPNLREVEFVESQINRLYNLIIRQKSLNARISNDLINRISETAKDAREAVSLTLVAHK